MPTVLRFKKKALFQLLHENQHKQHVILLLFFLFYDKYTLSIY